MYMGGTLSVMYLKQKSRFLFPSWTLKQGREKHEIYGEAMTNYDVQNVLGIAYSLLN